MKTTFNHWFLALAWLAGLTLPNPAARAQTAGFAPSALGNNGVVNVNAQVTYYDGSDGTLFAAVPLPPGASALQFRVTGGVITAVGGPINSPDGLNTNGQVSYLFNDTHWEGTDRGVPIGGTTGIDPALFGVFFSYSYFGTPPDSLNYRSDTGVVPDVRTLPSYTPALNQPFFIGDGFTSNSAFSTLADTNIPGGVIQTFTIPAGATYLLLGMGADDGMSDNSNVSNAPTGFLVHVFDNSGSSPRITGVAGGNGVSYQGASWGLTAAAGGETPLSWQWSRNGTNLTDQGRRFGAESNQLTFTNVLAGDTGTYELTVSNSLGVASTNVTLTVLSAGCYPVPSGVVTWLTGNSNAVDIVGNNNGTLFGGATYTNGLVGPAFNLNGTNGFITTALEVTNPQNFTVELWFKTTTARGGYLAGFASSQTNSPGSYDRNLYLDNTGALHFGVAYSGVQIVSSTTSYNDGVWHEVAATVSALAGMSLYVDGTLITSNPAVTVAQVYNGWWRFGENAEASWPSAPASTYFNGQLDEVTLYNRVLSAGEISSLYQAGSGGKCPNPPVELVQPQMGANFTFGLPTLGGQSYTVQSNTNLLSTNWVYYTNILGDGTTRQIPAPATNSPVQFFRVHAP